MASMAVNGAEVVILGGDFNQSHPGYVALKQVKAVRNYLAPEYTRRSRLLLLITELFSLKACVKPSWQNWTYGYFVFEDPRYFKNKNGVETVNVKHFDKKFSRVISWLERVHPRYNYLKRRPSKAIIKRLNRKYGWRKAVSLPMFRHLCKYFIENKRTIKGLPLTDIRLTKEAGWTDAIFVSKGVLLGPTKISNERLDPVIRLSDHLYIWIKIMDHIKQTEEVRLRKDLSLMHQSIKTNAKLPAYEQLITITKQFAETNELLHRLKF